MHEWGGGGACNIKTNYANQNIENNYDLTTLSIYISTQLNNFINRADLSVAIDGLNVQNSYSVENFINYGTISNRTLERYTLNGDGFKNVINYGTMVGLQVNNSNISNYGVINGFKTNSTDNYYTHLDGTNLKISHYKMTINKNAANFNAFNGAANSVDNSHLIFSTTSSVSFANANSRVVLNFGENFEFGRVYDLSKLFITTDGTAATAIMDADTLYSHLYASSDLFTLSREGNGFIVSEPKPEFTSIGLLYKANVKTMNTLDILSNSLLWQDEKASKKKMVKKRVKKGKKIITKKSYTGGENYRLALVPLAGLNSFNEAGKYTLSGSDMGLLGVFSANIDLYNTAGVHFAVSQSKLNDKNDDNFEIKTLNAMLGLNYRRDFGYLVQGLFLRLKGEAFYFQNELTNSFLMEALKPNNTGFGGSVYVQKDMGFRVNKINLFLGVSYKGLSTTETPKDDTAGISERYEAGLYNYIYADFMAAYNRAFSLGAGTGDFNLALGVRGNVTGDSMATGSVRLGATTFDMILDNDSFLGYANVGFDYGFKLGTLPAKLGLKYGGNFGDKSMYNSVGLNLGLKW